VSDILTLTLLKPSIENRRAIRFLYQGHVRYMCPHLLAKTKDDRLVVHGFQFAGASSRGEIATPEHGSWRFFYLDQVEDLRRAETQNWYPAQLKKSEGPYRPPAFIAEVLAIIPQ
jgi:hypothetical protein